MNVVRQATTVAIALAALSVSASSLAAGFPACTSHKVGVPCNKKAWDISVEGIWGQPTNDDLDIWTWQDNNGNLYQNNFVDPDQDDRADMGFRLAWSYHATQGREFALSWTRYDEKHRENLSAEEVEDDTSATMRANARFEFDAINAEFAQHVNLGSRMDLRLHAGVQYVNLDHHLSFSDPVGFDGGDNDYTMANFTSRLDAFGARFGTGMNYAINHDIHVIASAAVSLLVGDIDSKYEDLSNRNDVFQKVDNGLDDRHTVLPATEGRIGINYTHGVDKGMVTAELGYHVQTVYHSIIHAQPIEGFGGNNGPTSPRQSISNFGFHGPYLKLKYVSQVA